MAAVKSSKRKAVELADSPDNSDSGASYHSVATVILSSQNKRDLRPHLHSTNPPVDWGFCTKGELIDPSLGHLAMEDAATQVAFIPPVGPQDRSESHGKLSEQDRSDVICILSPASPAAYEAVQLIAATAPHHLLQNQRLSANSSIAENPAPSESHAVIGAEDPNDMLLDVEEPVDISKQSLDIALRLTSKVRSPKLGFTFGRNPAKCDLLISNNSEAQITRISNMHFRIYVNESGSIMVEDTSTNGTWVDERRLMPKQKGEGFGPRCTIHNGSSIQLVIGKEMCEGMRFMVTVPERDGLADLWARKLNAYITYREQLDLQARKNAIARNRGIPLSNPSAAIMPPEYMQTDILSEVKSRNLIAGTAPYHSGMHWNGGETYKVISKIGTGSFASVYKVARREDGELFAVKELDKTRFVKNGIMDQKVGHELEIMAELNHVMFLPFALGQRFNELTTRKENIVQYIDHHDDKRFLYIFMEFVPFGDLQPYVDDRGTHRLQESHCREVALQMCRALQYLHGCRITHRDIKPDNILVASQNPPVFKLSDFGLSKVVRDDKTFLKSFCGTLLYCAPEVYPDYDRITAGPRKRRRVKDGNVLKGDEKLAYTTAVDTWSLGAVLYHLLCCKPPYWTDDKKNIVMLEKLLNEPVDYERLKLNGISQNAIEFVQRMLIVDPRLRPTDDECLKHPWISNPPDLPETGQQSTGWEKQPYETVAARKKGLAEEELDASKLSLAEQSILPAKKFTVAQSKRKYVNEESADDSDPYPSFPDMRDDLTPSDSASELHQHYPTRLFGEITQSALRSSGVLGLTAQAALKMPSEGSRDTVSTEPEHQTTPGERAQESASRKDTAIGSLFGAEALVGRLNMDSPRSARFTSKMGDHPEVPSNEEKTREQTPESNNSSQGLYSATPLQTMANRQEEHAASDHESIDLNTQYENRNSQPIERDYGLQKSSHQLGTTSAAAAAQNDGNAANTSVTAPATTAAQPKQNPPNQAGKVDSQLSSTSDKAPTSLMSSPAMVPHRPQLGSLVPLRDSVPSSTIALTKRVTRFGRDPTSDFVWPDGMDTRVPKAAFAIIFWRSGIDRELRSHPSLDWAALENIQAIITTRTSQFIRVNGVILRRGENQYGKLYSGDVITVFEPQAKEATGKAAESLKFKVQIGVGKSRKPRKEGNIFKIENVGGEQKDKVDPTKSGSNFGTPASSMKSPEAPASAPP